MLVKTRGVVLKEVKFRDHSSICALYTRDFGRISVILKGGRTLKSRFSGVINTGTLLEVVLYNKSNRNIRLVSDARIIRSPMTAEPSLERFSAIYRLLETLTNTTAHEEKNIRLFDLLSRTLEKLCTSCRNPDAAVAWFLFRLIADMGFEPSLERCVITGRPVMPLIQEGKVGHLHLLYDPGGVAVPRTSGDPKRAGQLLPVRLYLLMRMLNSIDLGAVDEDRISAEESRELCDILQNYCLTHSDSRLSKKKQKILSQLLLR